jgi:hypothetical protein
MAPGGVVIDLGKLVSRIKCRRIDRIGGRCCP